ncbi:hypothetical protein OK074_1739 [Actinobacteria bacterium OK074]|nr:hypothetical protein OK074_1739 [Actinobacteria bacterium OK074]
MAAQSPTVLVTVTLPPRATLQDARRRLGLAAEEVDTGYGLVPVDPDHGTYVLLVTDEAAARIKNLPDTSGPYENPTIETFGPPRTDDDEKGGGG